MSFFSRSYPRLLAYRAVLTLLAVCMLGGEAFGQSARRALSQSVPEVVSHLSPIASVPVTDRLHLAIGLPLQNESALDEFLRAVYDPQSPDFHHYLTPQEFTARFGPPESDYASVIQWAETNGLTVTATFSNRVVLDVNGSVADIERAFQIHLNEYQHPTEARTFYAPDAAPSAPSDLSILAVSGLDNFSVPHPKHVQKAPALTPQSGSGSSGSYGGNDFRAAYIPGVTLNGAGESVALLEFDGYYTADITTYESTFSLPAVTLTNVAVDGGVSKPGTGNSEVALDIEMVIAMSPGVSKILVYEAPNPSPWADIIGKMANDNSARQISCSWGGGSPDATSEQLFKQMAAQGQSFYNASGDSDAFTGSIPFPSDSTNITQVGGTTLTTSGAGGSWVSETVWNWGRNRGSYTGSSGGISTYYSIPSWQLGINMITNHGSTTMRNVPDVALTADNIHVNYNNGSIGIFGGTSCAAPLWAAYTALVNQRNVANAHPPVGFANPALYSIGKTNLLTNFHDITTGNNYTQSSPTNFPGVPGYDLCTGWGTPNANLINTLAPLGVITNPAPPVAAFVVSVTNGAVPLTVNFTNQSTGATNYSWNFGDGHTSTATNPANTYTNAGSFTVLLTAVGPGGTNVLTRANYVVVTNVPPSISTPPQSLTVVVGSNATFSVTANGTAPLSYQWRFNTTNIAGATGNSYTRTNAQLTNAGSYTVVVTNIAGSITSAAAVLTVTSPPPVVAFVASVTNGMSPLIVNFTNLSSGATNYSWTFGDGHTNNVANPTNTYTTQGSYTVTLTAFGPGGQTALARTNYIVLSNAAPVLASIANRTIHVGTTLLITNAATDPDTAQTLTFSLNPGAPAGATMTTNGLFGWTPDGSFANTTNTISARVADNGVPALSDTKPFTVTVLPVPSLQSSGLSTSGGGSLTLSWGSISGQTYRVQYATNLLETNWATLTNIAATNSISSVTDSLLLDPEKFYRIQVLP